MLLSMAMAEREYNEKYKLRSNSLQLFEEIKQLKPDERKADQPIAGRKNADDLLAYKSAVSNSRIAAFTTATGYLDILMQNVADGTFSKQWSTISNECGDKADKLLFPIFWYRLVCEIGPDSDAIKRILSKCRNELEKSRYNWASIEGECVMKLYIILVHQRGVLLNMIKSCDLRDRKYSSIHALKKFLECDYVRIIRNSGRVK